MTCRVLVHVHIMFRARNEDLLLSELASFTLDQGRFSKDMHSLTLGK